MMPDPICLCNLYSEPHADVAPNCPIHGIGRADALRITLDRRELASILAGLRLLQWASGSDSKIMPFGVLMEVADLATGRRSHEPLSDAELRDLARRLG